MHFLLKMVIFQPGMLVNQRVIWKILAFYILGPFVVGGLTVDLHVFFFALSQLYSILFTTVWTTWCVHVPKKKRANS